MKKIIGGLALVLLISSPALAIDSEPILKTDLVAIDSEPILKLQSVAIDSEPILIDNPKAIDSEPILKEALHEMSVIYKKDGKFIKVTYKTAKVEEMSKSDGEKREKQGLVHPLKNSK